MGRDESVIAGFCGDHARARSRRVPIGNGGGNERRSDERGARGLNHKRRRPSRIRSKDDGIFTAARSRSTSRESAAATSADPRARQLFDSERLDADRVVQTAKVRIVALLTFVSCRLHLPAILFI